MPKKTYTSKSGKKRTPKQKAAYYATDWFKKPVKKKPLSRKKK